MTPDWPEQLEKTKAKVKRQRVAIRALKQEVDSRCGEVSKLERELLECERRESGQAAQAGVGGLCDEAL